MRPGAAVTGPPLTARQVADLLGVSTETVLRWTRRGELPAIRLPGGAIRFREDELEAWLIERATPGRGSANHPAQDAAHAEAYCRGPATPLRSLVPTTPEDEEA
jgi:excisionase family DNA binding protein